MAYVKLKYDKLEESLDALNTEIKSLQDAFDKQNELINSIADNDEWSGLSKEICTNKYTEISSKYETIIEILQKYKSEVKDIMLAYKDLDEAFKNSLDKEEVLK